jgi:hypothetical protein
MQKMMQPSMFVKNPIVLLVMFIIGFNLLMWLIKDSARRGVNPFFWIIMYFMLPGFGLLLYLIFRPAIVQPREIIVQVKQKPISESPSAQSHTVSYEGSGQTTTVIHSHINTKNLPFEPSISITEESNAIEHPEINMPVIRYCATCGTKITQNGQFCASCGSSLR